MSNQNWDKDPNLSFINPYTFAALGGEVQRSEHTFGDLTGRITCTLTVKSPLAIPDSAEATPDRPQTKHMTYPFFRMGDVPTIPGSQLRGAIRSVYETLSNSCFSVNNNNTLSSRHTAHRKPGILRRENGKWYLYEAKMEPNYKKLNPNACQAVRAWYSLSGKATSHLFTMLNQVKCHNLEDAIKDFNLNLEIYEKNAKENTFRINLIRECRINENDVTGNKYPVFYEIVTDPKGNSNVYLCPSQIGRSVYAKKLDDLLGPYCACSKRSDELLCRACALFGTLSKRKDLCVCRSGTFHRCKGC